MSFHGISSLISDADVNLFIQMSLLALKELGELMQTGIFSNLIFLQVLVHLLPISSGSIKLVYCYVNV